MSLSEANSQTNHANQPNLEQDYQESPQNLEDVVEKKLRQDIRAWIEDQFESYSVTSREEYLYRQPFERHKIERMLTSFQNPPRELSNFQVFQAANYTGALPFFEELTTFTSEISQRGDATTKEKLWYFVNEFGRNCLSGSPNLFDYTGDYLEKFTLAEEVLDQPMLNNAFRQSIIPCLCSFGPIQPEMEQALVDHLHNHANANFLKSLRIIRSVAGWAMGNGAWAFDALEQMTTIIQKAGQNRPPLINMYTQALVRRLEHNLPAHRTHTERQTILQEQETILRSFDIESSDLRQSIPVWVAKNAIGLKSKSSTELTGVSLVNLKELSPDTIDIKALQSAIDWLVKIPQRDQSEEGINDWLWEPVVTEFKKALGSLEPGSDTENLAQLLANIAPELTSNQWSRYLISVELQNTIRADSYEKCRVIIEKAGQDSEQRSYSLCQEALRDPQLPTYLNGELQELYDKAKQSFELGNLERTYNYLDTIMNRLRHITGGSDPTESLIKYLTQGLEQDVPHQPINPSRPTIINRWFQHDIDMVQNLRLAEQKSQQYRQEAALKVQEVINGRQDVQEVILENESTIKSKLLNFLLNMQETNRAKLQPTNFLPLQYLMESPDINPFNQETTGTEGLTIQQLHDDEVKRHVEASLGVKLREITLQSQVYLLNYLLNADQANYGRLTQCLQQYPGDKPQFLESFLALQMGDEFGESLITIAEASAKGQLEQAEVEQLFQHIEQIRQTGEEVGQFFAISDEQTARSVHHAIVRRTTEILAVAESLAKGVTPHASLFQEDQVIQTNSLAEVNQALAIFSQALTQAATAFKEAPSEILSDENERLGVGYQNNTTVVQLRWAPRTFGEHNSEVEFDGEPRVNILVNLDHQPMTEQRSDPARAKAFSLRLDWESRVFQENGEPLIGEDGLGVFDVHRPHATVSLDIGGLIPDETDPNWKVGKQCAIGNTLRSTKQGRHKMLNHVREVFAKELGDQKTFIQMVLNLRNYLLAQIPQSSPAPHQTPRPERPAA